VTLQPPAAPKPTLAAIHGSSETFPVRRIYCVGRNYAAHAREMGQDDREPPFFFTKWPDTVLPSGSNMKYPPGTANLHYELELVVALGKGGKDIPAAKVREHVYGYGIGLDMTRRDLQFKMRDKGRPWDVGKNFDQAAPLAPIVPAAKAGNIDKARIWLEVNGAIKQDGNVADMIWSIDEIIEHLSRLYTLEPGDLIFSGTPEGVGPVVVGDTLVGRVDGLPDLNITLVS